MRTVSSFETPILLLVFNRLDTTRRVFEVIRKVKPTRLFVSGDGPRHGNLLDPEKVNAVREFIADSIDWPCTVSTLYRLENLGCKEAVSSGIDWFFSEVDNGIILEDDCLPHEDFFEYCEIMLQRFKSDYRIWHIGGVCCLGKDDFLEESSYYYSNYMHIWGWATWSDRWKYYTKEIPYLDDFKNLKLIEGLSSSCLVRQQWLHSFNSVELNKVNTWDFQWYYCVWSNGGLAVLPKVNLVSNIGFGQDSTHTSESNHLLSNMRVVSMDFNQLIEPKFFRVIEEYDRKNERILFNSSLFVNFRNYFYYLLNNLKYDRRDKK